MFTFQLVLREVIQLRLKSERPLSNRLFIERGRRKREREKERERERERKRKRERESNRVK